MQTIQINEIWSITRRVDGGNIFYCPESWQTGALLFLAPVQPMQQYLKLWLCSGAQGPEAMRTLWFELVGSSSARSTQETQTAAKEQLSTQPGPQSSSDPLFNLNLFSPMQLWASHISIRFIFSKTTYILTMLAHAMLVCSAPAQCVFALMRQLVAVSNLPRAYTAPTSFEPC